LIKNIQAETGDAMQAMEKATADVLMQAKLVETAGFTMKKTQSSVDTASTAINKISKNSLLQLKNSQALLEELNKIRLSINNTQERLAAQNKQVEELTQSSSTMLDSIRIFKLPQE
jgi:methyl-accepting chemotaxis protein